MNPTLRRRLRKTAALVDVAAAAVRIKAAATARTRRLGVRRAAHLKQAARLQRALTKALTPVFRDMVYEAAGRYAGGAKAFCPTGEGGGIDNSCSPKRGMSVANKAEAQQMAGAVHGAIKASVGDIAGTCRIAAETVRALVPGSQVWHAAVGGEEHFWAETPSGWHVDATIGQFGDAYGDTAVWKGKPAAHYRKAAKIDIVDFSPEEAEFRDEIVEAVRKKLSSAKATSTTPRLMDKAVANLIDPRWRKALVDAALPPLARGIAEAAWAEVLQTGAELKVIGVWEKATSATAWLADTGQSPPPGVTTEYPPWLMDAVERQLTDAFAQPYWGEIVEETTRDDIRRVIEEGLAAGLSTRDIADGIRTSLGEEYYHNRAKVIAITECLPADTLVEANVLATYRRRYNGPWIEIVTKAGRKLSGTPNHPVLTQRGWVGLGDLEETDCLLCKTVSVDVPVMALNPDVKMPPTTLGDVWNTTAAVGIVNRRAGAQPDFHGDGMDGQIDVTNAFGLLAYGVVPQINKSLIHFVLPEADLALFAFNGYGDLLSESFCNLDGNGFFDGTDSPAVSFNDSMDTSGVDPHRPCNVGTGLASFVPVDDLGGNAVELLGLPVECSLPSLIEQEFSSLFQGPSLHSRSIASAEHDRFVTLKQPSNGNRTLPGGVEIDHLLIIRRTEFAGHVYNLLTEDGYFIANGVVTSNCGNALNGGRKAGIDALADELGPAVGLRAVWLSVLGDTTRDAHANLDGVPADADGMWDLNGHRIPWPGHWSLPPGDRCNCLCTVSSEFGVTDDAAAEAIADYNARVLRWQQGEGEFAEAGYTPPRLKAFCPTGPGGGIDNSCPPKQGQVSEAFQDQVKLAVASIPKPLREKLGVRVRAVHSVKEAYEELAENKPRGWFSGAWKEARGLYDPDTNQAVVAEFVERSGEMQGIAEQDAAGVLRHEYGHGADKALAKLHGRGTYISSSGAFDEAHEADVKALLQATDSNITPTGYSFKNDAAMLTYFIQPTGGHRTSAGRSEAFAEAFAAIHGGGCVPGGLFEKWFPRTIRHVADLIEQIPETTKAATSDVPSAAASTVEWRAGALIAVRLASGGAVGDIFHAEEKKSKAFCPTGPGGGIDNSCPPKKAGGGLSGIDTSGYDTTNPVALWAQKKIAAMEALAAAGDWDGLSKLEAGIDMNPPAYMTFKQDVATAWANLMAAKDKQVQEPPANAETSTDNPGILTGKGWKQLGGQLGTEKGGTFLGPDGKQYYVKQPDDPGRAHNEVLASKLFALAGGKAPPAFLVEIDGKLSVAREWADTTHGDWSNPANKAAAAADFAMHAWLANWDAAGASMENIQLDAEGKAVAIDLGGSLDYKASGGSGKKPEGEFNDNADEWDTMRNPSINPNGAKLFGGMTQEQLQASAAKLKTVSNDDISDMVHKYGTGFPEEKAQLVDKLISRRDAILAKAGSLSKPPGPPLPGAIPPSIPPSIPPPPQITSAANAGMQKKLDAIHAAALTGNIDAVEAIHTNPNAKQTYAKKQHKYKEQVLAAMKAGGKANPDHKVPPPTVTKLTVQPSQLPAPPQFVSSNATQVKQNLDTVDVAISHALKGDLEALKSMPLTASPKLVQWHAELVSSVAEQLSPPPAPVQISESYAKIAATISKPSVSTMQGAAKVGKWAAVGNVGGVPAGAPQGAWMGKTAETNIHKKGTTAYEKMPVDMQAAINSYVGGGYIPINESLRKFSPDNDAKLVQQAIAEYSIPIPAGTLLSRKYYQGYSSSDSEDHYQALKPGAVIADPAVLSTSTDPAVWSGNVHFHITVANGVKGIPVAYTPSAPTTEKEVLLPPGQPLLVTQVDKKNGKIYAVALAN